MTDWTAGYVADIGYTYGYYTELNPLRVRLAFLNAGLVPPEVGTACELGFGQGMSINAHAAASVVQWHGTDFNPAQASFAQELAAASGSGAQLHDDAFADFCTRADLPDFDYIGLHGIWSWISDDNRAVIVDFIKRKLKVGGVLYISYNTQPGWSAMAPIRDLMAEYSEFMGCNGIGHDNRIDEALAFIEKLIETNPSYILDNPLIKERISKIKEQNRNYLAHEYFNQNWFPMPFSKMAEWLSPAKVQFACSALYVEHIDELNLSSNQLIFLKEIPDPTFRQSVRNFMVNKEFRKDYWVKGARKLNTLQQVEGFRLQRVILTTPYKDVSLKVIGSIGECNMSEAVFNPILDALSDHKVKTIGQLEQAVKAQGIVFAQLLQAIMILAGNGTLSAVQDDSIITKAKKHTDKLNQHLMNLARGSNDIGYLASPVTGGGINVGRFQQLFLQSYIAGHKKPAEWAQHVWTILAAQGQKLVKEGKTLESAEDNLAELTAQAQTFHDKQLPIMKALQVV